MPPKPPPPTDRASDRGPRELMTPTIPLAQVPDPGELNVDHVAHFVPDMDNASRELERLGFSATPFSVQSHRVEPDGPLQVKAAKDGPLLVSGNFAIVASSGSTRWHGKRAALCRCGESENKPFCDGSHKAAGFTAD